MPRAPLFVLASLTALSSALGCAVRKPGGTRDSGQSNLMDDTFAGQNRCNADDHDKPFVIEWDATVMSSFESLAASDIVFVKYEGCSLKVLDECKNDSIRGEQGAYKPPEWTSGQLETIDIHNEGELYAKLPLAQATLGGRVSGGEKFHMEYFVAGTRYASRDAVYEADLEGRYGCEDTTHFVYAYNLGAFALASASNLDIQAGGSAFGFGAGGSKSSGRSAEKRGGDLAACQGESMQEVAGCKSPIRLNLRKIRPGASPEAEAMAAPETMESASAAAIISAKMDLSAEPQARFESAQRKLNAGDGKGCVKELNAHDKLDPQHKSSDPNSGFATLRAMCVMKSGQCDAGKQQARKALEKTMAQWGAEQIDKTVDAYASMYCEGKMDDRDALLKAMQNLQKGAFISKQPASFCSEHFKTASKLVGKVEPRSEDDTQVVNADRNLYAVGPKCFEKAGDCKAAWQAFVATYPKDARERLPEDPAIRDQVMQSGFDSLVSKCAGKAGPAAK